MLICIAMVAVCSSCSNTTNKKEHIANEVARKSILIRSSWQTVNIGDIAHTPGVLALCEKYLPEADVRLWASDVGDGVAEMLKERFPNLEIILNSDTAALAKAFEECDFLLHGSGPYLVADKDVERWIHETGKPYGVYGISLGDSPLIDETISILNKAEFVFFRDTVSMEFAKSKGLSSPIVEFGPDGAFACDLRNDSMANTFLRKNGLEDKQFLCVIPKYRKTPYWTIPEKKRAYDSAIDARNQEMKEHDLKPYREAIIALVRTTQMKVLICPEDKTQMALGKEMLYDPLPEDVKQKVVWREQFWLTDEALSVYTKSSGLFGLEQHSPIMCIGNGIPALVGRFEEQSSKGYMWYNIGLSDWFFDSDIPEQMAKLTPTVLRLSNDPEWASERANTAKEFVEKRQKETMMILKHSLYGESVSQ